MNEAVIILSLALAFYAGIYAGRGLTRAELKMLVGEALERNQTIYTAFRDWLTQRNCTGDGPWADMSPPTQAGMIRHDWLHFRECLEEAVQKGVQEGEMRL